eukprot:TRINITY_DN222_c0_g2_i1.p1 TRINITY_DN222_c0_g2~~TRINITY_DN222_c0_g2_i1.p1  ORF type:complete len:126 (+),score=15.24 TRINITY_DN222_c0_g2_i1:103-480(+)
MATASATVMLTANTAVAGPSFNSSRRKSNVVYIGGLNSFGGLKAYNNVASLGLPKCTHQAFATVLNSLRLPANGKSSGGGGALTSTCNEATEIFKIAAIMNGLVLIGVAVGFVLLRIEATVEESE